MRNLLFTVLGSILLGSFCFAFGKKFSEPKVCFSIYNGDKLYIGVDNPISIIAEGEASLQLEQVSVGGFAGVENDSLAGSNGATITGGNGNFIVRVDSFGIVDFNVKTKSGLVYKGLLATPVPVGVSFGLSRGGQMSATEFKAQKGLLAVVECCGFDASCSIVEFTLFKLNKNNSFEKAKNIGGKLNEASSLLVQSAQVGDIYWFKDITYRCPGSNGLQYAEDIAIEIK